MFEICEQRNTHTDRQTDTLVAILRTPEFICGTKCNGMSSFVEMYKLASEL